MMTVAQLDEMCRAFRADGKRIPDDALVSAMEADVAAYRLTFWTDDAGAVPPREVRKLLWFMGWLIYETSWNAVQQVRAAFESIAEPAERASSENAYTLVRRLGITE